jgi:hypothetical protein
MRVIEIFLLEQQLARLVYLYNDRKKDKPGAEQSVFGIANMG